jgi:hypothetical protein
MLKDGAGLTKKFLAKNLASRWRGFLYASSALVSGNRMEDGVGHRLLALGDVAAFIASRTPLYGPLAIYPAR